MRFSPREKGKTAFCRGFFFEQAVFPFSRGKNRILQGVENRGSLISVPLALRVFVCQSEPTEVPAELSEFGAELSKFSLSKQYLQFPNAVVLNAVVRRNTQMRVQMRAKERKIAQKGAKERKKEGKKAQI